MARAFVAVVPPPTVLDAVERAAARAREVTPGGRWTPRAQLHVTLAFLGDDVDLGAAAAGLGELALRPGRVGLGGGGAFPQPRRGRVLWVGVGTGSSWLAQAAAAARVLVADAGATLDDRPFHPHVTLARVKRAGDLRPAVEAIGAGPVGEPWTASEVVLFESVTASQGARHTERLRVELGS